MFTCTKALAAGGAGKCTKNMYSVTNYQVCRRCVEFLHLRPIKNFK